MSDDAQTLLSRATPRRANGDPIENEMTRVNSDVLLAAFDEIERLRAQVESLAGAIAQIERAAAGSIYSQEGIHAIASDALKSLEVKP